MFVRLVLADGSSVREPMRTVREPVAGEVIRLAGGREFRVGSQPAMLVQEQPGYQTGEMLVPWIVVEPVERPAPVAAAMPSGDGDVVRYAGEGDKIGAPPAAAKAKKKR